jgi:hypothetical protein
MALFLDSEIGTKFGRRGSTIRDSKSRKPAIVALEVDIKTFCFRTDVDEGKVLVGHEIIRIVFIGDFA